MCSLETSSSSRVESTRVVPVEGLQLTGSHGIAHGLHATYSTESVVTIDGDFGTP